MKARKVLGHVGQLLCIGALLSASTARGSGEICSGPPSNATATIGFPADCWEGPSHAQGTTYARGSVSVTAGSGRVLTAYKFNPLNTFPGSSALTQGFTPGNVPTCEVSDSSGDGNPNSNSSSMCNNTSYALVTAGF